MKKSVAFTSLAAACSLSFGTGLSIAGTISLSAPFTDDASTGISTSNTYTHTVSGGTSATVNGVSFDVLSSGATPANFVWTTSTGSKNQIANNNGDWVPATGGVTGSGAISLLGSFAYNGTAAAAAAPALQTYSLSNLTIGQLYDTRLYIRVWDTEGSGRPINLSFTHGAESDSAGTVPEDRPSLVLGGGNDHQAYYVSYAFEAKASQLDIVAQVAGGTNSGSAHIYALTNQVVPEPSGAALLGLGGLALLLRRRRR